VKKLKKKGAVLEERDSSWMIVEMANDKIQDGIERWQQVDLKLKLGEDGYAYTEWFTVYDVNRFDIIPGTCWVHNINGMYHFDHRTNEILITQGDIPWEDREKAVRIDFLCRLRPHSEPDNDTINEAAHIMGIEIIGKQHLHRMRHQLLARSFMVQVRYDNPDPVKSPDKFQGMLCNFETCGLFAEPTYDTTWIKPQFKLDILPEEDKTAPYWPPYRLSPKEDAELQ
jgi:hypothetical protein